MMKYNYLLLHHLKNSVQLFKNKTALIIDQQTISYQKLYEDSFQLMLVMKEKKIDRGDRVFILSGNTYLSVVGFWASVMCDAVSCVIDVDCTGDTLQKLIEKGDPKIIIFEKLTVNQDKIIRLFKINCINNIVKNKTDQGSSDFYSVKSKNTESDLLMMMHTSGSTGEPKGVMLSNRNVTAAIESITTYLNLQDSDVILSVLPLHFDYGLYQMLLSISVGATLVLEKNLLFPSVVAYHIEKYQATLIPCVPLMAQLFYLSSQKYKHHFSSVRIVTNTGEHLSKNHIQKMKNLFPSAAIFSMYGLTECKRCSYVPPDRLPEKSDSIGISMPNLEMWVQDENGNRLPPYQEGDLMISGPTVMMGYWKNSAETQRKIQTDSFGKRILVSGDRACMDEEGYFYFKGRNDFIVKYKGAKLNCFDYAKKLTLINNIDRSYLFLDQSNGDQKLIVCIETNAHQNDYDDLQKTVHSHFSSTQQPDFIYFMRQFPSLSNGKLNKQVLEKMALEKTPCI